jgi:hypothetical protein
MGLSELHGDLTEDYLVKIYEYNGQVLIDSDVSKYSYGANAFEGFNELGFFMIRKDIRFLNQRSSFQLHAIDFIELARELVKEAEE